MLSASGVTEAVKLVATVTRGRHVDLEEVTTIRGPAIEVDSEPPIEFNVDGELVGLRSPVSFDNAGVIEVRVPSNSKATG